MWFPQGKIEGLEPWQTPQPSHKDSVETIGAVIEICVSDDGVVSILKKLLAAVVKVLAMGADEYISDPPRVQGLFGVAQQAAPRLRQVVFLFHRETEPRFCGAQPLAESGL